MIKPTYSDKMIRPDDLSTKARKPTRRKVKHGIPHDYIFGEDVLRTR